MSRANYYREQAQVLAALALATEDPKKAESYKLAALEHLERADESEQSATAYGGQEGKTP